VVPRTPQRRSPHGGTGSRADGAFLIPASLQQLREGSLLVDDEFELQRLLDGQIGRLRPPHDAIHQPRGLPTHLDVVRRVARQTTPLDEEGVREHRGRGLPGGRLHHEARDVQGEPSRRHDAVHVTLGDRGDSRPCLILRAQRPFHQRHPEAARRVTVRGQHLLEARLRGVVGEEHALEPRHELAEDLHTLGAELRLQVGDAGHVAAGPGKAGHRRRRYLSSLRHYVAGAVRHEDVRAPPDEVSRRGRQLALLALREADADNEVNVLAVAQRLQALTQPDDSSGRSPGGAEGADRHRT
jgi:hypothetical protein